MIPRPDINKLKIIRVINIETSTKEIIVTGINFDLRLRNYLAYKFDCYIETRGCAIILPIKITDDEIKDTINEYPEGYAEYCRSMFY